MWRVFTRVEYMQVQLVWDGIVRMSPKRMIHASADSEGLSPEQPCDNARYMLTRE